MKELEKMKEWASAEKNWKSQREVLKNISPPCIPYLGMFLTDLMFIEQGNKDEIEEMINFQKRNLIASVIMEIQLYQSDSYALVPVPEIQNFIRNYVEDQNVYDLSLSIIPRGGEKELNSFSSFYLPFSRIISGVFVVDDHENSVSTSSPLSFSSNDNESNNKTLPETIENGNLIIKIVSGLFFIIFYYFFFIFFIFFICFLYFNLFILFINLFLFTFICFIYFHFYLFIFIYFLKLETWYEIL